MKKPQDFPGASAESLAGRAAAAPFATHVDVCNERVHVDKGKHFMGPHDATQTAKLSVSQDAYRHVDSLWPIAAAQSRTIRKK